MDSLGLPPHTAPPAIPAAPNNDELFFDDISDYDG